MPSNLRFAFILLTICTVVVFNLRRYNTTDAAPPALQFEMAEDEGRLPAFEDLPLVCETNPARDDGTLDVARCVALHNFLIKYGWAGMGHRLVDVPHSNFFEKYENNAGK